MYAVLKLIVLIYFTEKLSGNNSVSQITHPFNSQKREYALCVNMQGSFHLFVHLFVCLLRDNTHCIKHIKSTHISGQLKDL